MIPEYRNKAPSVRRLLLVGSALLVAVCMTCLILLIQEHMKVDPVGALLRAAEEGDAEAQFAVGRAHERGEGVARDLTEAAKWYRKAAESGLVRAQVALGAMHYHGQGVSRDMAEAARWYRSAAENGDAEAQAVLAGMYSNGEGVPESEADAAEWYRKAAESENVGAQVILAGMYEKGTGVVANGAEAAYWYRQAAARGNNEAQCRLGVMYLNGQVMAENRSEALRWLYGPARDGSAEAMYHLRLMYSRPSDDPALGRSTMSDEDFLAHVAEDIERQRSAIEAKQQTHQEAIDLFRACVTHIGKSSDKWHRDTLWKLVDLRSVYRIRFGEWPETSLDWRNVRASLREIKPETMAQWGMLARSFYFELLGEAGKVKAEHVRKDVRWPTCGEGMAAMHFVMYERRASLAFSSNDIHEALARAEKAEENLQRALIAIPCRDRRPMFYLMWSAILESDRRWAEAEQELSQARELFAEADYPASGKCYNTESIRKDIAVAIGAQSERLARHSQQD